MKMWYDKALEWIVAAAIIGVICFLVGVALAWFDGF